MGHPLNNSAATKIEFSFDGDTIPTFQGTSVAAALMQAGRYCLRVDEFGAPKGAFCGIGICWECRCWIDGISNQRACLTLAKPGMRVETQRGVE